jgi:3,4-dihydroxy 2-butanone 4-phosphate synthase/GTP cyclohydrolase II
VRLLTNNPAKTESLVEFGIPVVERVPLAPHPTVDNLAYLTTKRDRMGHDLPGLPDTVEKSLPETLEGN